MNPLTSKQATHGRTVRFAFPLVLFTTLIFGAASVLTNDSSYITIKTSNDTVVKDQDFVVEVFVTAHIPINAIDITLAYPDDVIQVDSIDTGTSVITLWTEDPYARDGVIYLRGGTFRKGFLGEHKIASIKAHATTEGVAKILVGTGALVAGDGKGTEVPALALQDLNEVRIVISGEDGIAKADTSIDRVSDANNDGKVDMSDIMLFMSAWLTKSVFYDFNSDGKMTFRDFSILLSESYRF